jgi:hypothetical protein
MPSLLVLRLRELPHMVNVQYSDAEKSNCNFVSIKILIMWFEVLINGTEDLDCNP